MMKQNTSLQTQTNSLQHSEQSFGSGSTVAREGGFQPAQRQTSRIREQEIQSPGQQLSGLISLSSSLHKTQDWDRIHVQQFQKPAGEGGFHVEGEHTLSMSLASRPTRYLQVQDGKTYKGLYRKGDLTITPANVPFSAQWEGEGNFLQIRLATKFIQSVAVETLEQDCDRLELVPEFRTHNPQIEAIGMMLLTEIQQEALGSRLYLDSIANILAVNLLKHYTTTKPKLQPYRGGLPQRQLLQVLDYIEAHLDSDISLTDLANLPEMSQFHFSRLFKESTGISPHQYLIQQRVERAKRLLKQSNRLIADIATECGFNSHSHLSKQFRQSTGMTPKAYRTS